MPVHYGIHSVYGHRRRSTAPDPVVSPVKKKASNKDNLENIWAGETCFVVASGPSLTQNDVNLIKGRRTIVTNTTFRMVPTADALFFHDVKWYNTYRDELKTFGGYKVTISTATGNDVIRLRKTAFGNSGTGAIALAIHCGCKKIILLGADGQHTNKKAHWHGDHPKPLGNARSWRKWAKQYEKVAELAKNSGVLVLNASKNTIIDCFQKVKLEDCL